jgi:hypothetical protein
VITVSSGGRLVLVGAPVRAAVLFIGVTSGRSGLEFEKGKGRGSRCGSRGLEGSVSQIVAI